MAKREGGNVFNIRVGVAVTVGIKDSSKNGCNIHYYESPDYATAEMKIKYATQAAVAEIDWRMIQPNEYGDWVSQRSADFEKWPVLSDKKSEEIKIFKAYSSGMKTGRDSWTYSFSENKLRINVSGLLETYERARKEFGNWAGHAGLKSPQESDLNRFLGEFPVFADTTTISWDAGLKKACAKGHLINLESSRMKLACYRPFTKQFVCDEQALVQRRYQLPSMFPTPEHRNIGYVLTGSASHYDFGLIATDLLPNLHTLDTGQFFPRFTWEKIEAPEGQLDLSQGSVDKPGEVSKYGEIGEVVAGYRRVDNVTDEIKKLYRDALGADISGDDIFHFVYGKLHDPEYREKYAADLKKMLPHIETPATRDEFDKFAVAGEKLMALHVGYEDVEPYPVSVELAAGADPEDRETWRVLKMKWKKVRDPATGKLVNDYSRIEYNKKVTIANLPVDAEEYMLGSRSALAWIIDRYQVKKDKASGIVNDPNDWADEVGNPRYIVDLIAKVARVAVETNDIVKGL